MAAGEDGSGGLERFVEDIGGAVGQNAFPAGLGGPANAPAHHPLPCSGGRGASRRSGRHGTVAGRYVRHGDAEGRRAGPACRRRYGGACGRLRSVRKGRRPGRISTISRASCVSVTTTGTWSLLGWAENMASLGREAQKRFFRYAVSLLRESYMLSAGMGNISYLWGREREFCEKFAPFVGNGNIEQLAEENRTALLHISQNGNAKIVFTHYALSVSKPDWAQTVGTARVFPCREAAEMPQHYG